MVTEEEMAKVLAAADGQANVDQMDPFTLGIMYGKMARAALAAVFPIEYEYRIITNRYFQGKPIWGVGSSVEEAKQNVLRYYPGMGTNITFHTPARRIKATGSPAGEWGPIPQQEEAADGDLCPKCERHFCMCDYKGESRPVSEHES